MALRPEFATPPELREPPPRSKPPVGTLATLIGIAAAAIATPAVMTWEGKENDPYRDIIGVATVCWGDTRNVVMGQRQSDAQCASRLDAQLAEHARPVLSCTPGLKALADAGRPGPIAAAVSFSYNVGGATYCKSSVARLFNAGDIRGGCDFLLRYNRAGGRVVNGLTRRRQSERAICLKGAD